MNTISTKALTLPKTYFSVKDVLEMNSFLLMRVSDDDYAVLEESKVVFGGVWTMIEDFASGYAPMVGFN